MEHVTKDASSLPQMRTPGKVLATMLGISRTTPYIDRLLTIANLRYGMVLAGITAAAELIMIRNSLAMARIPSAVAKVGEDWIIQHLIAYGIQLLSALILVGAFFLERRMERAEKDPPLLPIKLVVTQFIAISLAFGIYISMGDLSRGNGLYAFLTQVTSIVCIFVIRPVIIVPVLLGSFAFMMHLAEQAGALSHGIAVNFQILWLILMILSGIKYYRHTHDGSVRELLADQSYHDMLTGLPNLRAFYRDMQSMLGEDIVLAVLDLDDFKLHNDIHGHSTGNRLLSLLASILLMEINDIASLYRMHGDEFVIIAPAKMREDVLVRIHQCQTTLQRKALQNGLVIGNHPTSFSIGMASGTIDNAKSINALLHRADNAMYEAKQERQREQG